MLKNDKQKKPIRYDNQRLTTKQIAELDYSDCTISSSPSSSSQLVFHSSHFQLEHDEKQLGIYIPDVFGSFQRCIGFVRSLTRFHHLNPALSRLRLKLIGKNVAVEIVDQLCENVCGSLEGTTVPIFSNMDYIVSTVMEESLLNILYHSSSSSLKLLNNFSQQITNKQHRPYSIVLLGTNGVGKTTTLAKLCAYFLSMNLKVGFGACDTFRSGAIEQLKTHAAALRVPLYNQGYERDASNVCAFAIKEASKNQLDVILIDTAGRMQNNEPLMRSASKLVRCNHPDLVLFVGEALVGTQGAEQVMSFDRALMESHENARGIDGIIVTKMDTVDNKIGAIITMVYTSRKPIFFLGTGQQYTDLKVMNDMSWFVAKLFL